MYGLLQHSGRHQQQPSALCASARECPDTQAPRSKFPVLGDCSQRVAHVVMELGELCVAPERWWLAAPGRSGTTGLHGECRVLFVWHRSLALLAHAGVETGQLQASDAPQSAMSRLLGNLCIVRGDAQPGRLGPVLYIGDLLYGTRK
jgi:hypothetical protein